MTIQNVASLDKVFHRVQKAVSLLWIPGSVFFGWVLWNCNMIVVSKVTSLQKNCNKNLKQRGARLWTVWELLLQSEHIGNIHRVSGPLTMIMCATCSTSWTSVMLVIIVKVVWGYLADNKDWRWGVREQLVWHLRIVWRWIPSGNNEISGGLSLFITHWLSWITSVS